MINADYDSMVFLSTPSSRRATYSDRIVFGQGYISIHALREEGDSSFWSFRISSILFLSTPSARRATGDHLGAGQSVLISIHALREEGDHGLAPS